MTQGERIKEIRKTLGLTLEKFGEKLGVTKTAISRIEKGERGLTEQMTKSICREFNVNEAWLRTGEGNMFNKTESSAVERLCTELKASELERQIISAYFKIEPNIRDSFVRRLIHEVEAKRNNDMETTSELTPSMPDVTQDVMSELAEIKRQNQEMAQQNREVVRQNKELLTRLEVLEKEEDEWQREQMKPSIPPTRFHT